jgi:hypothetical protein
MSSGPGSFTLVDITVADYCVGVLLVEEVVKPLLEE